MMSFPLLAVGFFMHLIAGLFVLCCITLVLIILIQKGRGGGLSAAFGGGMAGGVLGSKTGDFLTWVTITLAGVFLLLAVVLAKFYVPAPTEQFNTQQQTQGQTTDTSSSGSEVTFPDQIGDANGSGDTNVPNS